MIFFSTPRAWFVVVAERFSDAGTHAFRNRNELEHCLGKLNRWKSFRWQVPSPRGGLWAVVLERSLRCLAPC